MLIMTDTLDSVDDVLLQHAASSIPKGSIFLIEDIDCAFSSREDQRTSMGLPYDDYFESSPGGSVTLSGLLNVIDGIGSEEGNLFFATVRRSPSCASMS
jgi:chaperone BCS1